MYTSTVVTRKKHTQMLLQTSVSYILDKLQILHTTLSTSISSASHHVVKRQHQDYGVDLNSKYVTIMQSECSFVSMVHIYSELSLQCIHISTVNKTLCQLLNKVRWHRIVRLSGPAVRIHG